ncbi:hypothetical protein AMTRI_Chr03g56360 [Amborella trichopoda]
MPTFSETASAFRSRFRFQEAHVSSSEVECSPALAKSASKELLVQPISSIRERESHDGGSRVQSFEIHEDPSFWKDHNVQVVIRIRPLSSSEISLQGHNRCVKQDSVQSLTWTGHPETRFTFDVLADEFVSQEKLFKVAGLPMVENCIGGYNSCMFAYGQTGSGKTHTMLGDIEGGTRRHSVNCGMTPRVFELLFSRIQKEKEARKDEKLRFTCKCSFLEIYNEQILDLLDPSSTNLQIREDAKKGVYVENITEFEVNSARDVLQQLVQGAANRKVAATNMNHASSRSHSVFTCVIESKWEAQGVTHHRFARLNLVDLAGSERQKSSGAEGERLKEATNINKSLSTLGLVIMNLVNISNGKSLHVPYRDSKLTFLLQDSLGGNSKTTIIANISPSNCCALETLSTLKFAQRAKFIRNNAIVNEDASGDVLAMRIQIQQLKKEVNRLRGVVNGGTENQDSDSLSVCFPGSPGSFKWDDLQGSLSPLTSQGKVSQRRDLETALVGALRMAQDKEIAMKALVDENQAAMQLTKQREEEIQSLKMRLRFREAGIKRLEAVASAKISAEAHLLQEKNELLKEIEILRTQVDRNQEVTRFAMENLRLKEELRRFQSFHEDGEREMMSGQISILQDKLFEALEWKLMHDKDTNMVQKGSLDLGNLNSSNNNLLLLSQDPSPLDFSAVREENETLHMQVIHNQREVEALRKNLNFCLEAKEKLERRVDDLTLQLEEERKKASKLETEDSMAEISTDQMELKAMVDAIAAASQREAELCKENEDLRSNLRVLLEDNNKLIELYEVAIAENKTNRHTDNHQVEKTEGCNLSSAKVTEDKNEDTQMDPISFTEEHTENQMNDVKNIEDLERQLHEMHEENERLMALFEKAMQERDEFKRMVWARDKSISERQEARQIAENFPEKLVEVDEGKQYHGEEPGIAPVSQNPEIDEITAKLAETSISMGDIDMTEITEQNQLDETEGLKNVKQYGEPMPLDEKEQGSDKEVNPGKFEETMPNWEELIMVGGKLDFAQHKLIEATGAMKFFSMFETNVRERKKLSKEIDAVERELQVLDQQISNLKHLHAEADERKAKAFGKLSAVKLAVTNICTSDEDWAQREAQARSKMEAETYVVGQKREKLVSLQARKHELESTYLKTRESESKIKEELGCLKLKIEEEDDRRRERERALTMMHKLDTVNPSSIFQMGKAADLLKSEEDRTNLRSEMKKLQQKLVSARKESHEMKAKLESLEAEILSAEVEMRTSLNALEEAELALNNVVREKPIIEKMREERRIEMESLIIECHDAIFELGFKEEEIKVYEVELLEKRRKCRALEHEQCVSEKVKEELLDIHRSISEAKYLLGHIGSSNN